MGPFYVNEKVYFQNIIEGFSDEEAFKHASAS